MFLTSGQRQYYNTIKKLGNKKPQKTIKRPKVSDCSRISTMKTRLHYGPGTVLLIALTQKVKLRKKESYAKMKVKQLFWILLGFK